MVVVEVPTPSFNGAALVGVRRDERKPHDCISHQSLQRSRTRGSAESSNGASSYMILSASFNGAALVGVRRAT